jgi:hypothetical protein
MLVDAISKKMKTMCAKLCTDANLYQKNFLYSTLKPKTLMLLEFEFTFYRFLDNDDIATIKTR